MSADATSPLTFAVGDIHGCLDKLQRLLTACEAYAGARPARYVFLGDYIDRGPQSRGVVELLIGRQSARPGTIVCLRGNHEQMAIDAHGSDRAVPLWLANNGASTLRNYGGRISQEHLAWLAALPFCHDDGLRFFVHGHTPLPTGTPDLRRRRLNLDTAAVMGGPLSAAVFEATQAQPLGFLTDEGAEGGSSVERTGRGEARR